MLQIGVDPPHCAFDVHGTQVPVVAKQTGVAPPQSAAFVAEHCAARAARLARRASRPPHSPSPAHARQVWVAVLQTGVDPPHCAFDVHGTQVAVGV